MFIYFYAFCVFISGRPPEVAFGRPSDKRSGPKQIGHLWWPLVVPLRSFGRPPEVAFGRAFGPLVGHLWWPLRLLFITKKYVII
jgi:hypothetical protein